MNDEELKALWSRQTQEAEPAVHGGVQVDALRDKLAELQRSLKLRDIRELVVAAVLVVVFGIYLFTIPYPVTRLGSLIVIGGLVIASWKMIQSRRKAPRSDAAMPVALWLKQERERMHHEAELLRTVLWWYILPILFGVNVFYWGFPHRSFGEKVLYTVMTVLLGAGIYWLNQYARRKELLPVKDELENMLKSVDAGAERTDEVGPITPKKSAEQKEAKRRGTGRSSAIILTVTIAAFLTVWNFSRPREVLRVPEFSDVSAFGEAEVSRIDRWLEEQVVLARYPSLSVAIMRDGKVVYQRAFGFEDIEAEREATPDTMYRVASVTKAFTATLAVMLHARGVVDLDAPVVKYLPEGVSISTRPEVGAKITLRQLASHTSGLPRGVPGAVQTVEGRYELEPERLYGLLAKVNLEYDPGTAELYSNLGFGLLGHVLEHAAGKPLGVLIKEMVCEPLQLQRTGIEGETVAGVATGYSRGRRRSEEKHSYRERLAGSGGLVTSATDLTKFLAAQLKPGIFSSEMLAQLHTPFTLADGREARTALGWTAGFSRTGIILNKNGGRNNCSAWIGFRREDGVGVVVLTNCGEPDVDPMGYWLLERSVPGADPRYQSRRSVMSEYSRLGISWMIVIGAVGIGFLLATRGANETVR